MMTNQLSYNLLSHLITQGAVSHKLTVLVNKGILSESKLSASVKNLNEQFLRCLKQEQAKISFYGGKEDFDLVPYVKKLINTDEELKVLASKKGFSDYVISDEQTLVKTSETTVSCDENPEDITITFLAF